MSAEATEEYGDNDGSTAGVYELFPQTADLSAVSSNDVIAAAQRVTFTIQSVKPDVYAPNGTALIGKLKTRFAIGPDGTDGEGKYARKNLFADLVTYIDKDAYPTWNALVDYKQFLKALGFDVAAPPEVTAEFVSDLVGREIVANITRTPQKRKVEGVYVATGEFENKLTNFRSAE